MARTKNMSRGIIIRSDDESAQAALQKFFNKIKILDCAPQSETKETSCRKNPAGKMTKHERVTTVYWCCPCDDNGSGGCAPAPPVKGKAISCCQITITGDWKDTGAPCGRLAYKKDCACH